MINLDLKLNDENIKKTLQYDYIDRNRYINGLLNLINNLEEGKIISIDGAWGSGKTWFVKSIEFLLNNEVDFQLPKIDLELLNSVKNEYMTFYYNAWENDDATSPMLSLIYKLVNDSCLKMEATTTGAFPRILNTLVKYATAGIVDIKQDIFGEQWNNKKITDEIITSEEIKDTFRELIEEVLKENKNKILIIVDEVDRCKPSFAVDLLENIKHFYDNDRIVFLVATNNLQLGSAIKKVYGNDYDGNLYLDKIFDLTLELPNNYLKKYINAIDENIVPNVFKTIFPRELAKEYKISMREYNRYLKSFEIIDYYFDTSSSPYYLDIMTKYIIVPIALLLRIVDKEKYHQFISGNGFSEIEELVRNNKSFNDLAIRILSNKDDRQIVKINEETNLIEERKTRQTEAAVKVINKIYIDLLVKNSDEDCDWSYSDAFNKIIDVISLFN